MKLNVDLNASNNVAGIAGYRVEVKKIVSYIVAYKGLKPVSPRGGVALDPSGVGNPAPSRVGSGS